MDYREIINDLCNVEQGLSEWEVEFVDNMAERLKRTDPPYSLSTRQMVKINQIYDKVLG